jgi:hypothetical protein
MKKEGNESFEVHKNKNKETESELRKPRLPLLKEVKMNGMKLSGKSHNGRIQIIKTKKPYAAEIFLRN